MGAYATSSLHVAVLTGTVCAPLLVQHQPQVQLN